MTGEYETTWLSRAGLPPGQRLRFGLTTERGVPVEFLVQLEYWHGGVWLPVARFDQDREHSGYRDAETAGLHMDVLDPDGTQIHKKTGFPPVPINDAPDYAETYLVLHHQRLVQRFEKGL